MEKWFPLVKENLSLYNLIPVKLNGDIHISRENAYHGGPTMNWNFEVLQKGESSYVNFRLDDINNRRNESMENYSKVWKKLRVIRREKSEWIRSLSGSNILDIFGEKPVTNLVFNWLESDLKYIGWIK